MIDPRTRRLLVTQIEAARAARKTGSRASALTTAPALPAPLPGELTPEELQSRVLLLIPLFKECYQQGLEHRSITRSKVRFTLHLIGEPEIGTLIESAELGGDPAFLDAELSQCLQETMMAIELPPTSEGSRHTFTIDMQFSDEHSDAGS